MYWHRRKVLAIGGASFKGFWWEFVARVWPHGYSLEESPITHRPRAAKQTQVYRLHRLPGIGWIEAAGLMQIWQDFRHLAAKRVIVGTEEKF
jgi:hypothetical protein